MGIKHRAGQRKVSRKRRKSQTRLQSDMQKNERRTRDRDQRREESTERLLLRRNRRTYGTRPPPCPFCGAAPRLTNNRRSWECSNDDCDASVGCHPQSTIPLGTLADRDTRKARVRTHHLFDMLWTGGRMTRKEAYTLLAESMQLDVDAAHIGKFDLGQCEEAGAFARATLRALHVPISRNQGKGGSYESD